MKSFLKRQVNWTAVCGASCELPWQSIWSADNPVELLNEHRPLLIKHFVVTKVIHVYNKDKPWFNDEGRRPQAEGCFGGIVIALELTGMSLPVTRGWVM